MRLIVCWHCNAVDSSHSQIGGGLLPASEGLHASRRIRPRTAPQVRPAIGASTLKVSKFCEATNAKVWVASCAPRLCLAVHRLMMTMVWLCAPGRKQWKPHLEAVLNSSAQPESDAAHGGGRLAKLLRGNTGLLNSKLKALTTAAQTTAAAHEKSLQQKRTQLAKQVEATLERERQEKLGAKQRQAKARELLRKAVCGGKGMGA